MLALLVTAVLVAAPLPGQDGDPVEPERGAVDRGRAEAQGAAPARHLELPEDLLWVLDEVARLATLGEAEEARALLEEFVAAELSGWLADAEPELALLALDAVDLRAESVGAVGLVGRVREQRYDLLAARVPADDSRLLVAAANLAVARKALGDLEGALELEEQVCRVWSGQLPEDHRHLLMIQLHLASTRCELGDLSGAQELGERVLAVGERSLAPDDPLLLGAKLNLATTRHVLGDLEGALELLEEVHEIWGEALPEDDPDRLRVELNLAGTRKGLGDLVGARELEERVCATWRRQLPPEHPDRLAAETALAATLALAGDLAGARELEEHVLAVRARTLPADHPDLLGIQENVAVTLRDLGYLAEALELEEHVLAARERLLPADHPHLLEARENLGLTCKTLGDLDRARGLLEAVHEARERTLPDEHPAVLATRLNLAAVRHELGDYEGALELLERMHAILRRRLPPGHPDLVRTEMGLAALRFEVGDVDRARELFERVHAAWEGLPADHPDLLAVKLNLVATRAELGDLEGALALAEEVRAVRASRLAADHPSVSTAESALAGVRYQLGDTAGALVMLERVHAARARLLPPDHPKLLEAGFWLATMRYEAGEFDRALELTLASLDGQRRRIEGLRAESPRVARAAALLELRRLSEVLFLAEVARRRGHPAAAPIERALFAAVEGLRLVSTRSSEVALAASRRPELTQLRERLGRVRGELNDLALTPEPGDPGPGDWRGRLFELAVERDELERELRSALRELGVLTELPTSERVAERLAPGAAFVGYFRYRRYVEADAPDGVRPPPTDSLLALVLTADGEPRRVELGPCAPLEELVARWRAHVGQPLGGARGEPVRSTDPGERVAGARDELGQELRRRLLDPCLAAAGEALPASLLVVADDFLHLVPLDALPWTDGRLVGEVLTVGSESSVQRLLAPVQRPKEGTLVALGAVEFGSRVAALPAGGFAPLAGSGVEVEALGQLFERRFGERPVLLTGAGATKRELFEQAPRARFLHVATHGWFASETSRSMFDEGARPLSVGAGVADAVLGFAPETLCGLALAGANRGPDELGRVAGILTAEELATLDLARCELAVLSACETSVGIRRAGQGIQSLQAALHAAGARAAITSLWKVDDAATRELMERFYTGLWQDGLGKAEALWRAKAALREAGRPLRDWAGWVLSGDPD